MRNIKEPCRSATTDAGSQTYQTNWSSEGDHDLNQLRQQSIEFFEENDHNDDDEDDGDDDGCRLGKDAVVKR